MISNIYVAYMPDAKKTLVLLLLLLLLLVVVVVVVFYRYFHTTPCPATLIFITRPSPIALIALHDMINVGVRPDS